MPVFFVLVPQTAETYLGVAPIVNSLVTMLKTELDTAYQLQQQLIEFDTERKEVGHS